jgi:hypothetical protein
MGYTIDSTPGQRRWRASWMARRRKLASVANPNVAVGFCGSFPLRKKAAASRNDGAAVAALGMASNAIAKVASLIIRLFPFRLCLATLGVALGSTPFG